jgi:predicted TIM-barrel fold metal-dependent hydrolase
LRGVILETNDPDLPLHCESNYDPIWDACEETGMSVNIHGGTGIPSFAGRSMADIVPVFLAMTETGFWARRPLWYFIWGGVLERHPGLKLVFTEQGAAWVTTTLPHLDFLYDSKAFARAAAWIKKSVRHRPSEYWRRQCFVGASFISRREAELRHDIGVTTLMFGVDYPHQEGTWGRTAQWLRCSLGAAGVSEREARQIAGENAARCYGFDLAALTAVADRSGPELGTVLNGSSGFEPEDDDGFALLLRPADA